MAQGAGVGAGQLLHQSQRRGRVVGAPRFESVVVELEWNQRLRQRAEEDLKETKKELSAGAGERVVECSVYHLK